MIIRKYAGGDEKTLLKRIRSELGPEAVILHTSFQKQSGIRRFFHRDRVEILAGGGFKIVKDYPQGQPSPLSTRIVRGYDLDPDSVRKEINEIKALIAKQNEYLRQERRFDGCPEELVEEYVSLASHLSENLAQRMIRRITEKLPPQDLKNRAAVRQALLGTLKDLIRCADGIALKPGQCTRVAFIGPTGVGKTTTIAKLLSIYATKYAQDVAVITNDTYRVAATEQIKRVAQIVGVPVRICRSPEEIRQAVAEFAQRDLVLIDTAGRSQKHAQRIQELRTSLEAAQPQETHLVVSLTAHPATTAEVIESFSACAFDRIVLTKLDEAVKVGVVLDVLDRERKELTIVTTGQENPRDIEIADSSRIASLILGEEPA